MGSESNNLQPVRWRLFSARVFSILTVRVSGALCLFLLYAVLSRYLPADTGGYAMYGLSLIIFFGAVGRLGMDRYIEKTASRCFSEARYEDLGSLYQVALTIGFVALGSIAVLLIVFAKTIAVMVFGKPELEAIIRFSAPGIASLGLSGILAHFYLGIRRPAFGISLLNLLGPLCCVALFLLLEPESPERIGMVFSAGFGLPVLLGIWGWPFRVGGDAGVPGVAGTLKGCVNFWVLVLVQQIIQLSNQLIGVRFFTAEDFAALAVGHRVTQLIPLILVATNAFNGARFASLDLVQHRHEVTSLLTKNQVLCYLVAFPMILAMVLLPEIFLFPFGVDAQTGKTVIFIFLVGQFVNISLGPSGHLLLMKGYDRIWANSNLLIGFVVVLMVILFSWSLGVAGAALAGAAGMVLQNLWGWFLVRREMGVNLLVPWK